MGPVPCGPRYELHLLCEPWLISQFVLDLEGNQRGTDRHHHYAGHVRYIEGVFIYRPLPIMCLLRPVSHTYDSYSDDVSKDYEEGAV